jgi:hypothetical protein
MVADTTGYDWITLTVSSGLIASAFSVAINFYVRSRDEKKRKRKMLYYPLFLACKGIIEVTTNYKDLGETRTKELFISNAKMLDEIASSHAIVYLEGKNLHEFLQMKNIIDENFRFVETRNLGYLESRFESKSFKEVKKYANNLCSLCQEEVKELQDLPGEME